MRNSKLFGTKHILVKTNNVLMIIVWARTSRTIIPQGLKKYNLQKLGA